MKLAQDLPGALAQYELGVLEIAEKSDSTDTEWIFCKGASATRQWHAPAVGRLTANNVIVAQEDVLHPERGEFRRVLPQAILRARHAMSFAVMPPEGFHRPLGLRGITQFSIGHGQAEVGPGTG